MSLPLCVYSCGLVRSLLRVRTPLPSARAYMLPCAPCALRIACTPRSFSLAALLPFPSLSRPLPSPLDAALRYMGGGVVRFACARALRALPCVLFVKSMHRVIRVI